jgi:hypothetical protein
VLPAVRALVVAAVVGTAVVGAAVVGAAVVGAAVVGAAVVGAAVVGAAVVGAAVVGAAVVGAAVVGAAVVGAAVLGAGVEVDVLGVGVVVAADAVADALADALAADTGWHDSLLPATAIVAAVALPDRAATTPPEAAVSRALPAIKVTARRRPCVIRIPKNRPI